MRKSTFRLTALTCIKYFIDYVNPESMVSAAKASLRDTGVLTILDSVCDQSDVSHKNWRRSWMRDSWRSCWSRARGSFLSLETTPVRQMEWFDR